MVHRERRKRVPESGGKGGGPISWGAPGGDGGRGVTRGSGRGGKGGENHPVATPTLHVGVATSNGRGGLCSPHRVREIRTPPNSHHAALPPNRLSSPIPTVGGIPPMMIAVQVPLGGGLAATTLGGGRRGGGKRRRVELALKRRDLPLERRHLVGLRPTRRGRGRRGGGGRGGKHHTSSHGRAGERAKVREVGFEKGEQASDSFITYHRV